jgi:hypothetical protein
VLVGQTCVPSITENFSFVLNVVPSLGTTIFTKVLNALIFPPAEYTFHMMLFSMKECFLLPLSIQMPVPNYDLKFFFFLKILGVQQHINIWLMILLTRLTICKTMQKFHVQILVFSSQLALILCSRGHVQNLKQIRLQPLSRRPQDPSRDPPRLLPQRRLHLTPCRKRQALDHLRPRAHTVQPHSLLTNPVRLGRTCDQQEARAGPPSGSAPGSYAPEPPTSSGVSRRPSTHLQVGICKPKTYTDGTVRYGFLAANGEPNTLDEALSDKN